MSTRVGTLQAPKSGGSILPAAVLAALVMVTIAVVAISIDHVEGRPGAQTSVGRHVVVTTPSELSGQTPRMFVGGTAANTPTELNGGIVSGFAPQAMGITAGSSSIAVGATKAVQAAIIASRNASDDTSQGFAGAKGNTPSELTGGIPDRYARHQRI